MPWLLALVVIGAVAGVYLYMEGTRTPPAICDALARARVVHLVTDGRVTLDCEGVEVAVLDASTTAKVFGGSDARPMLEQLTAHKGSAVAVAPATQTQGIGAQLAQLAHVPGLRGVVLDPTIAVYASAREPELSAREREALAYVARALFRGAREPSLSSFPPSLRKVERVEVMVSLSERGEPRLWRSARGTSIARALLTATRVARDRWREREAAMGGPLRERLSTLDVEVSLLSEDGTLTQTTPSFVDRAITKIHGVGFDYRNAWHYALPDDVQKRGAGSAHRALLSLAKDQGIAPSAFAETGTRVYRFVVLALGRSDAGTSAVPLGSSD